MNQRSGMSGCQVAAIVLAILLIAPVCLATGLVVGGGVGLVTGGAAGYAVGRARSTRVEPHIEVPIPQIPGDEEWRLPEEFPELPLPPEWEWPHGRAHLGVYVRQLEEGAEVRQVVPGSPASEAGLREGDLILAVDDDAVTRETPLAGLIAAHEPGDVVVLTVERAGREREIEVELGEWPVPDEPGAMWQG